MGDGRLVAGGGDEQQMDRPFDVDAARQMDERAVAE